jgi:hypothetical protein
MPLADVAHVSNFFAPLGDGWRPRLVGVRTNRAER